MEAVLEMGVRLHLSQELNDEYDRNASKWFRSWLKKMWSRRLVDRIELRNFESIRGGLQSSVTRDDAHLVAAAIQDHARVLSLDERARIAFVSEGSAVPGLRGVLWANPSVKKERVVEWIKRGLKDDKHRRLGEHRSRRTSAP